MANEKQQQYPIRVNIARQGPAQASAAPSTAHRVGAAAGGAVSDAVRAAVVGTNPLAGLTSTVAAAPAVRTGVADFFRGLAGFQPATAEPKKAAVKAEATPRSRPASEGITTTPATNKQSDQDVISSAVRNLLAGPFSRNDLRLAAAAMPAAGKPQEAKDKLTAEYAALTQGMFNAEMAKAQQLAASGDAEGAAAMELSAAEKLQRNWGAVLFNPANMQLAELMQNADTEN
jgi:hypothetical protein